MKILITGGSGFIGTHIIRYLLEDDSIENILNIDINTSSIVDLKLQTIQIDIKDEKQVSGIDISEIDYCIHLAALCKEPGFMWHEYFETNHMGTVNTIALCEKLQIEKIIFTSTMMVYQASEDEKTENSITTPDTAYGISKLLAEKELISWRDRKENRILKIIRPAVVFGENENANFTRLYSSLKKGFFPYVGRKKTIKSNIYVNELVSFIDFLIKNDTKKTIYNFSFPERHELHIIINAFKSVFSFHPFCPILPYKMLLFSSYFFEFLNAIGIRNPIHHRRIQKLYYSTNIYPKAAFDEGYMFKYNLKSALEDWKQSDDKNLQ